MLACSSFTEMNMTQETPAESTIDWGVMGSPKCDSNAQQEALEALGFDKDAKPLTQGDKLAEVAAQLPQFLTRDANGNVTWNPLLDIAKIGTVKVADENGKGQKEKLCIEKMGADGQIEKIEFEAALIAAAQIYVKTGKPLKDIPIQQIVEGMPEVLRKITGDNKIKACGIE
jgi:hypothetical protein